MRDGRNAFYRSPIFLIQFLPVGAVLSGEL
jgi:hypothetical protein